MSTSGPKLGERVADVRFDDDLSTRGLLADAPRAAKGRDGAVMVVGVLCCVAWSMPALTLGRGARPA